uniref:Vacuolar fusion protein MON1 homolog n=1 Tax=Cacopsylla melanoneura TaxID=428564 RepID=A0A8D8Z5F7_9HEMI
MGEVSVNLSCTASTSSFQSAENTLNLSTEEINHSSLASNVDISASEEQLNSDFLQYEDKLSRPVSEPVEENEELSSDLRQLMEENIEIPDIPSTPMEEIGAVWSFNETNINSTENFWLTKEWQNKERHIFILSSSGKPVYSRYGCEDKLATLFGVMQALVSFVEDSDEDSIKSVKAGDMYFSFLSKGYLIVVSVGRHHHRDETLLQQQLLNSN